MHLSIRLSHRKPNKVDKEIHILESKIDTLNNNIQNLFGEVNRFKNSLQRLSQECSSLQSNCQQQNVIVRKFKLQQDASEQDLLEIKQKLEDLHYATYDGSLIWIIDEFQRKYRK
jgi:chromosome segregation ATPase